MSKSQSKDFGSHQSGPAAPGKDIVVLPPDIQAKEDKVRKGFWKKLRRFAGQLPFANDLVTAYYCAMDPNTPLHVRATLLGALAYFIMPIDIVPDFIAGLGFADDAAILAYAIRTVSDHIKPEHRTAAAKALEKENT